MGRNYLAHASGDAINAVLAAAGYNFRRRMVEVFVAQNPDRSRPSRPAQIGLKSSSSRTTKYGFSKFISGAGGGHYPHS